MTNKVTFTVKSEKGYSHDLNLQIGNELKIIKGKDPSKQGCAILTLDDKFIDFIPSPERFWIWEKLESNINLYAKATIINVERDLTIIEEWGKYPEDYKTSSTEGCAWSLEILIEYTHIN